MDPLFTETTLPDVTLQLYECPDIEGDEYVKVCPSHTFTGPLITGVGIARTATVMFTEESHPVLFNTFTEIVAVPGFVHCTLIELPVADPIIVPPATVHE